MKGASQLEIAVDLIIPDNTAFTAATALRGLGYRELERITRTELYQLEFEDGARPPEAIAAAFRRAEVVFNPNKHRLSFASPDSVEVDLGRPDLARPVLGRPGRASSTSTGFDEYEAVVSDREDDTTRLVALLRRHFGLPELRRLRRATAWSILERDGPAGEERLDWSCRELLCNPYSQTAVVRRKPGRLEFRETARPASNAQVS